MLTLEGCNPFHRRSLPARRRGRRAPKGADGAHGAASGARTARGREADRRDSGDARARAPRATDRAAGAGHESAPPVPRYNFRLGETPKGEHDGGKGGAPLDGRGGGRGASPREMISPALPHATADAASIGQASARRQAAGAPEGRKGHAPARRADARESAASGQADQTDDGEAASGRGSNCPPPRAPETARPRQRTATRRRGGRRRRRSGGTRTQEQAATHATSAERLIEPHQQRGRRRRERRARGAERGHGRRTRNTLSQRSEQRKAERTGNRTSHRAQSGRARRRSGGGSGRLCASVAVFCGHG